MFGSRLSGFDLEALLARHSERTLRIIDMIGRRGRTILLVLASFAFIWLSYATADFASEIFGSIWGRHCIRVWGLGDLNRKSWVGVVAGFVCTLVLNVALVWANRLPGAWLVLGVLLALLNPLVELYSPRGTDDFTMATVNALVCLGYGWLVLA